MTWATLAVDGRVEFYADVPTLSDMQQIVGGNVDAIECRIAGSEATVWIADEGKLVGEPQRNWKAEYLLPLAGDWIAGNVALTGGVGPQGETLALTPAQVQELRRIDRDVHVLLVDDDGSGVVVG